LIGKIVRQDGIGFTSLVNPFRHQALQSLLKSKLVY